MVDKISEEVAALKKDKKSMKRKSSDTTEVVKKKKKEKVKDVDGDAEVTVAKKDKVKEDNIEEEVSVKKKKPYFRDKGEKGVDVEATKPKSKFSISLPVGDAGPAADLPVLKSSGKGPKIIIAQEKKKVETKKTENQGPTKLSKRKRKHLNAGGTLPEEDPVHESKGMGKALKYLNTWEEDRESWKFEKCRQIWLLHNAYEESKVSEGIFPSLLRYMESIKGGMRQGAMDIARQKVEKGTKWEELSEAKTDEEVRTELGDKLSECELKRAQQILEIFS
eukprot:TRINITY_DN3738_c0_g1_i1.p1 TRINITY_DN3738_c0_g1~~TRINITY_DN3738_c0_g1_i1.p1  ORF type:complete len:289 (-),score=100.80 TRINITY_DN3738_c0_g1_i1:35-868(-)